MNKSLDKCLQTSREEAEPVVAVAKCYTLLFRSFNVQGKRKPMEQRANNQEGPRPGSNL